MNAPVAAKQTCSDGAARAEAATALGQSEARKKLLFLAGTVPNPRFGGAPMRAYTQVLALARYFDVVLVVQSVHPDWTENDIPSAITEAVREVHFVRAPAALRQGRDWGEVIETLPGGLLLRALNLTPELCRKHFARAGPREIASRLRGRSFDFIHCVRLTMLRTVESVVEVLSGRPGQIVVDLDDFESKTALRRAEMAKPTMGRQIYYSYYLDALKFRFLERRVVRLADAIMLCSSADCIEFNTQYRTFKATVLPNTVADRSSPSSTTTADSRSLLFVGHLRYPPNVEAIKDFIANVLPKMRQLDPRSFTLRVVGVGADSFEFDAAANPEVETHADVPDLAPYYQQASVVIAPIRWGGGTRIKIIEAFSFAKPVVATTIGAEGLDVTDGDNILVRDTHQDLAEACVSLLNDRATRDRLSIAARQLYLDKYSTAAAEAQLAKLYGTAYSSSRL